MVLQTLTVPAVRIVLDDIMMKPGVRRFLATASDRGIHFIRSQSRRPDLEDAITNIHGNRNGAVFFFVYARHPEDNIYIARNRVTSKTGVPDKVESRELGLAAVRDEMEPGHMGPFLSEQFIGDAQIIIDDRAYRADRHVNFSAGHSDGYFQMGMRDAYAVLDMLHPGKVMLEDLT